MQASMQQLSRCAGRAPCCSGRSPRLAVRAQAPLSGNTGAASSNAASQLSAVLPLDRPAGGGSRSFDLPRSSDVGVWAPRSDLLRPSGGAARGTAFAVAAAAAGSGEVSIDRPGGRGGRDAGLSSTDDAGATPSLDRPGGRGGRDAGLSSSDAGAPPSLDRPGGRGGRDAGLSSRDNVGAPPSIDRPGGRGGRDGPGGGGGSGGGGGGDSGDSSSGSGSGDGFSLGKGAGAAALYAGVMAAAWFGHQAWFAPKPEPVKPCCAGKGKGKKK